MKIRSTVAALVAAAVLVAACGDDSDTASTGGPETGVPERIVSMSATATEMLFAFGAGDQVIAVDDQSNFPSEAPTTALSAYEPNVEAVVDHDPDLVILPDPGEFADSLDALDIEVFVAPAPATIDDVYAQLIELGRTTGHEAEATELAGTIEADLDELASSLPARDELASSLPARDEPLTYYHELDNTLFSVTSGTFIGGLYAKAGLENVADAAADAESGSYPQLSAEYLVAEDPDLVFLADTRCCGEDADSFGSRPGFGELTAVTNGHVVELDDDIASRWGPRIVDFFAAIVAAVNAVPAT